MKKKNHYRIFQKVDINWDFDIHVHTNWSQDNLNGPAPEEYLPVAERYNIQIGFADHFEVQYYRKYGGHPKSPGDPEWKLRPETIDAYIEQIDSLKEQSKFISSGLEIDYYPWKKEQIAEFLDDYYDQFDFIIGSVHEIEPYRPVTIYEDFQYLVNKYGGFKPIVDKYWELIFEMVESDMFDIVGHPDVVYRFMDRDAVMKKHPEYLDDKRVIDLGLACMDQKMLMEVNVSGLRMNWKQTHPKKEFVYYLYAEGLRFVVGSDSHNLEHFYDSITSIREMNYVIKTRTN